MSPEDLGGAQLHCATSGVADHLAESEPHAIAIARAVLGNLHRAGGGAGAGGACGATAHVGMSAEGLEPASGAWEEPLHPPEELRGAALHVKLLWLSHHLAGCRGRVRAGIGGTCLCGHFACSWANL